MINLHILSALAFAGLGSSLGAVQVERADPQSSGEQEKPAVEPDSAKSVWEYLSGRYDANGDGKIAKDEYPRGATQFARLDKDKNGFIEEADSKQQNARGARGRGEGRGARGSEGGKRPAEAPTEGSNAPDFELETLYPMEPKDADKDASGGEPVSKAEEPPTFERVKLSSWKGKKHVALVFGSYT